MANQGQDTQTSARAKPKAKEKRRRRARRRGVRVEPDLGASVEVLEVYGTVIGSGKAVPASKVKASILEALS
ncbi:MAG TPA: hypothetical protein VN758_08390 [Solirubrobacterales bacterium]|nr:hypothetical protein [Solirubrobacterales bacterium]